MKLSDELVSQFVKITNDEPEKKTETTVYATTVDNYSVIIDGSDRTVPVDKLTTVKMDRGDRVTIKIKDHTAIVTGNLSSPSAKNSDFQVTNEIVMKTSNGVTEINDKIVTINGAITTIGEDIVRIDAGLTEVKSIVAGYITVEDLDVERARIDDLIAADVDIRNELTTNYLTANEIQTTYLTATQIAAEYAKTETLESNYAQINLANVSKADIGTVLANIGLITQATIVDGHVTGYLDSVEINANDITAGTLTVDRLVISGTDKSIVYALNNTGDLTSTEVDTINGDVITKRTIAADHIIAGAITANELHSSAVTTDKIAANAVTANKISVTSLESIVAKIGSFSINNALYSNNHTAYNSSVDGVYVGSDYISLGNGGKTWLKNDGSVSIGDGVITYNAINKAFNIDLEIGGRNIILNSSFKGVSDKPNILFDSTNRTIKCVSSEFGQSYTFVRSLSDYGLNELRGKTVTLSGEYMVESDLTYGNTNTWLGMEFGINRNSTTGGDSQWLEWLGSNPQIDKTASNKWTKFSQTHKITDFDASSYSNVTIIFRDFIGAIKFRNLKVEFGDKATDWTPAPEDIDNDISNAGKTATDYLNFSNNGLVVGNLTASTLGKNALIDSEGFKVRSGNTVNSFFGADLIELAKSNESATISMLNGTFKIYYSSDMSESGLGIYGKTSTGEDRLAFQPVNENDNLTIGWGGYTAGKNSTNIYGHNLKLTAGNDMSIENDRWQINIDGNLFGKASNNSFLELIGLSSDNNTTIGHGGYSASLGKTNIYGNKIQHIVNAGGGSVTYKPYYEKGDSIELEWYGSGFISSSSSIVFFTIPLAKPAIGATTPTVTVSKESGSGLRVRQNGSYVYGATSSTHVIPSSYKTAVSGDGNFIRIEATMSNTTNAMNNEVCGIHAKFTLTFN